GVRQQHVRQALRTAARPTRPARGGPAAGRAVGVGPAADPAPAPPPLPRPSRYTRACRGAHRTGDGDPGRPPMNPTTIIVILLGATVGLGVFLILQEFFTGVPALGPALRQLQASGEQPAGPSSPGSALLARLGSRLRIPE